MSMKRAAELLEEVLATAKKPAGPDDEYEVLMAGIDEKYTCEDVGDAATILKSLEHVVRMIALARILDPDFDHSSCGVAE